jgi:pimeloyl-ACP methyl ester carboxylesterase
MKQKEQTQEHLGRWAGPEDEQRYRALEDELWREAFPTPPDRLAVETAVGATTVYRWPGTGVPVVFLHGMGATSLMWAPCVTAMAGRTAYAIDTPGDVGRSTQRFAFRDAAHLAEWLDEPLAALGTGPAHLAGASYGGWLALNQAVRAPDHMASISLVEPVGLAEFRRARFMLSGLGMFGASLLPGPLRRQAAGWVRIPALADKRVTRMATLGFRRHPFRLPPPTMLSADQLAGIALPTLLLLGAKSAIHRATQVRDRVQAVLPGAHVEIVAGSAHALPVSHPDLVAARITAFVDRVASN